MPNPLQTVALGTLIAGAASAWAHVTLPPGPAVAGRAYEAAFRVGHACQGARSTTALAVRLPRGFVLQDVPARAGWTVAIERGEPTTVRWSAQGPAQALPDGEKTSFVLRGRLSDQAGTLHFPVLQSCDVGQTDWAQLPAADVGAAGGEGAKLPRPAARLEVLAADAAPLQASGAWVRAAVAGQSGTGGFMTLLAGESLRLVGVSTPAAAVAEVHEMKMDGDTMRMRPVASLELPAHQSVQLKPGGYHLMLMQLKQPLTAGQQIPLTLTVQDAQGARRSLTVQAPVAMVAPGGVAAGGEHGGEHKGEHKGEQPAGAGHAH